MTSPGSQGEPYSPAREWRGNVYLGGSNLVLSSPCSPPPCSRLGNMRHSCVWETECSIKPFLTKESESGQGKKDNVICPSLKPRWCVWRGGPVLGAGCRDEGKGADTARILLSLVTMVRVLKHDHICVFKCPLRRRRGWSVSTENSWGPREAGKRPSKRAQ